MNPDPVKPEPGIFAKLSGTKKQAPGEAALGKGTGVAHLLNRSIHTHTHIHTYIHTYIHTHTHTYIHTHTHTHIHTYTHTHTRSTGPVDPSFRALS